MNNCQKCGNPLQLGTTSCPICGTAVSSNTNLQTQKTVASVSAPVVSPNNTVQTIEVQEPSPAPEPVVNAQPVNEVNGITTPQVVSTEPVVTPVIVSTDDENPNTSVTSEVVAQPVTQVQQAPAPQPVEQPVQVVAQVQEQQQAPQPVQVSVQEPVTPVEQVQPVQQVQQVQSVEQVAQVQQVPVQQQVTATPVTPTAPSQQVVNQPASQPEFSQNVVPVSNVVPTNDVVQDGKKGKVKKEKKEKKPINKNIILIAAVVLIFVGAGYFLLFGNNKKSVSVPKKEEGISLKEGTVSSNGYKFSLADGWIVTEGNGNVIVSNTNEDSSVRMRFSHSIANIENINEDLIKRYVESDEKIKNAEIIKTEISSKDAYVLNSTINDLPTQTYFIGGGSRLLIGVTVIYSSKEAKEDNEKIVTEIIGTLSYADDSLKAINVIDMYKDIFNVFGEVISYSNRPVYDVLENQDNENNQNSEDNQSNQDNQDNQDSNEPSNDNNTSNGTDNSTGNDVSNNTDVPVTSN